MLWTHTSFSSSSPCGWSDFSCQTSTSKVVAFGPTRIWVFPRTWVLPGFMEPVLEIPWHPSSQSLTSEPKMTQMNKTVAPSAPEKKPRGGKRGVETLRVKIRLVGGLILEVLVAFRIGLFLGTCWNSTVKSWRNPTVGAWRHWYGPRMWRFLLNKSEVKVWVTGLVAMPLPWEWSWDFITKMVFFSQKMAKKRGNKKKRIPNQSCPCLQWFIPSCFATCFTRGYDKNGEKLGERWGLVHNMELPETCRYKADKHSPK